MEVQSGPCPLPDGICFQRDIPTTFEAKNQLLADLVDYIRANFIQDEAELFQVRLCLDEGLQNAFSHGNRSDPQKRIKVRVYCDEKGWGVVIEDEGSGFSPINLPDPTTGSGLWMEHGRGLMIMCHYMDDVTYFNGGRTLRLYRRGGRPRGGAGCCWTTSDGDSKTADLASQERGSEEP